MKQLKPSGGLGQRIPKPASPENLSTFEGGLNSQIQNKTPMFERKDIARSIYLEKELVQDDKNQEKYYMFRLVTQSLKIVEFEADFSASQNCEFVEVRMKQDRDMEDHIEQRLNQGRVLNPTGRYHERVYPEIVSNDNHEILEKRTDLAKIVLHENWKLKTKFKFTMHNPPRDKQEKFIKYDKLALVEQYVAFVKAFKKDTFVIPFEKLPLPAIKARLSAATNKPVNAAAA